MRKPYFRPGAGSVIYNQFNEIAVFERADLPGTWQLQQGGMDPEETPEETLWRELSEETGLTSDDFEAVTPYPHWTLYTYPLEIRTHFDVHCLGQVHRWFFLRLKPGQTIDLTKASDEEFTAWRFSTFSELLATTNSMKLAIYTDLAAYFASHLEK